MTDNAAIAKLHSIWDTFVSDVSEVLKGITPEAEKDAETIAADAVKDAEAADAHDLDRSTVKSNIPAPPETVTSGDSSVPADPTETTGTPSSGATTPAAGGASVDSTSVPSAPPAEEPKPNIDPSEDQTGDTVAATLPPATTQTETFGAGDTPADSVSLGTTETSMPVAADPAATAAAAEAEALAHPSVSGDAPLTGTPMPDDVAAWLAANDLAVGPKPA